MTAMLPLAAVAASFCAITPVGKQCLFYDILHCKQAGDNDSRCVLNGDELSPSEAENGLRSCVVASLAMQCLYQNFVTCTQSATKFRGMCIHTQEQTPSTEKDSPGSGHVR